MTSSSETLKYSLANFNGHVTFQIHKQNKEFTEWAKTEHKYDSITVKSCMYPELDIDRSFPKIYLRGTHSDKDDEIVQCASSDPSSLIPKLHAALKGAVDDYRRSLKPSDSCTVRL